MYRKTTCLRQQCRLHRFLWRRYRMWPLSKINLQILVRFRACRVSGGRYLTLYCQQFDLFDLILIRINLKKIIQDDIPLQRMVNWKQCVLYQSSNSKTIVANVRIIPNGDVIQGGVSTAQRLEMECQIVRLTWAMKNWVRRINIGVYFHWKIYFQ